MKHNNYKILQIKHYGGIVIIVFKELNHQNKDLIVWNVQIIVYVKNVIL